MLLRLMDRLFELGAFLQLIARRYKAATGRQQDCQYCSMYAEEHGAVCTVLARNDDGHHVQSGKRHKLSV